MRDQSDANSSSASRRIEAESLPFPANEVSGPAGIAIVRQREHEDHILVYVPEVQLEARERDDRLRHRSGIERRRSLLDLGQDPRKFDTGGPDLVAERILHAIRETGGELDDRNPVAAHERDAEAATTLVQDLLQDALEAHATPLLALACAARARAPRRLNHMGENLLGPTLLAFGTDEQKARFLPPIVAGEEIWCQGYSEPNAGSDIANVQTRARRDGDEWIIDGQKVWTSWAAWADWCFVLCRTDPESKRHRGISILLVPMDLRGIEVRELPSVVGDRYFHEVFFSDGRVPVSCRLGPEHEGWDVVAYSLQYERVGAARYARAAPDTRAALYQTSAHGMWVGKWHTIRRQEVTTRTATLSNMSRSLPTLERAALVLRRRQRRS